MGVDVYLTWDGQTEEEREAQFTGFSIAHGHVGYLRASIGMVLENEVLRTLFPEEYWELKEPLEYDFKKNWENLPFVLKKYFEAVLTGELTEEQKEQMEFGIAVAEAFKGEGEVSMSRSGDILRAVVWANSLIRFFRLGMRKQEEGKRPRVRISW